MQAKCQFTRVPTGFPGQEGIEFDRLGRGGTLTAVKVPIAVAEQINSNG
jgi:hypothetical protein